MTTTQQSSPTKEQIAKQCTCGLKPHPQDGCPAISPQIPTPRTDEIHRINTKMNVHDEYGNLLDHARTLERELITTKQLAERYEQERNEYQEQLLAVRRELEEARKGKERYEYVRRLNPTSFASLFTQNIRTGKHFDDIVDDAINQAKGKQ